MIYNLIKVKVNPWTETDIVTPENMSLQTGDHVVIKTENGMEAGEITGFDKSEEEKDEYKQRKIIRKMTNDDVKKIEDLMKEKEKADIYCRKMIKKHDLPMKLVDTCYSFDGGRITFAFVADGRVDFRELVKDLTRHFQKSIRLQQVGMRDEAKRMGGIGPCGRELCCIRFKKELGNVTTELARNQQVAHRGSERLSGVCGRLMCCLAYEECLYKELSKNFPPIDSAVKTRQGKGKVVSWNILKQSYNVSLDKGTIIEIPLDKKLKKNKK